LTPNTPRRRDLPEAEIVAQRSAVARDAGLMRIGALTRWLMAGAAGLTGALALVAAGSFHGHSVNPSSSSAATAAANQAAAIQSQTQVPQPTVSAPVVVSGGS